MAGAEWRPTHVQLPLCEMPTQFKVHAALLNKYVSAYAAKHEDEAMEQVRLQPLLSFLRSVIATLFPHTIFRYCFG